MFVRFRADVLARIEEFVSAVLEDISKGQLPALSLVSRAPNNVHLVSEAAVSAPYSSASGSDSLPGDDQDDNECYPPEHRRLRLGSKTQNKTLTKNGGAQAHGVVRGK